MGREVVWLLISRALASLAQAVSLVLLARWSTVPEFGIVGAMLGLGMLVIALADMGVGTYVLRAGAVPSIRGTVPVALRVNSISSLAILFATTSIFVLVGQIDPVFYALVPLAFWVVTEKNADIWLNVAISERKSALAAVAILVRRCAALALFGVFVVVGISPVLAFTSSLGVGGVIGLVVSRRIIDLQQFAANSATADISAVSVIRSSFPYWIANLTSQVRNLDVSIVSIVSSPAAGGLYAAALRLTNPLLLVTGSLTSVLLPEASRRDRAGVLAINRKLIGVVLACAPVLFLIGWPLSYVGIWVLGDSYTDARLGLHVMFVSMFFVGICPIVSSLLQAVGREKFVARNGMAFTPVVVAAIALGAYLGGAVGAAVGIGCAFFARFIGLEFGFAGLRGDTLLVRVDSSSKAVGVTRRVSG
ncbi:hypothetical protein GS492_15330 [Rhodococcus hoagii]|nr:hypothetical protein [Prescottella equi]